MVYSFLYSPRKGTPAARLAEENPVSEEAKGARFARLLALQDEIALEANRAYLDTVQRVLCDGVSRGNRGMYSGRTASGKLVHFAATPDKTGEFCRVRITRADPYALHGEIID
jgi:tRNA-2-methylthio-N6-dimethylallyladenosine synthase